MSEDNQNSSSSLTSRLPSSGRSPHLQPGQLYQLPGSQSGDGPRPKKESRAQWGPCSSLCPMPVPTCSPLPNGPALSCRALQLQGRKQNVPFFHQLPPHTVHRTTLREHRLHTEPLCTFSYRNFLDSSSGLCPRPQDSLPSILLPFPMKNHPPYQAMGPLPQEHRSQYYGTSF